MAAAFVDAVEDFANPGAAADVEVGGAGAVAVFGAELAGEVEVEVFVRQKDVADAGEVLGFILLKPEEFGDGVAGERDDAEAPEPGIAAAEAFEEFAILRRGFGIVPQLGGADDLHRLIEDDETMLLAGDADGCDGTAWMICQSGGDGGLQCVDPPLRLLFACAGGPLDECVLRVAAAEDGAVCLKQEGFGALGSAVDAEIGL